MKTHNLTGRWGEEIARDFLVAQGYAICEQNWRSGHYEIDIIGMKDGRIIFVEVKTRSDHFLDPARAVDKAKMRRLTRAADTYIKMYDIPLDYQFDIINIIGSPEKYEIEHIPDAFLPQLNNFR